MKKLALIIILLLAIFSILRAYTADGQSRFSVNPSLIEFTDNENEISIGFGLIDSAGDKTKTWEIFPIRVLLRSGKNRFYLGLNGLSLMTRSGVNIEKDMVIDKVYHGDVISFGGNVIVSSTVEGNIWVFSANVTLKQGAVVKGDVVTLGGTISQTGNVVIRGNKNSIPEFSIPFIGLLTSTQSAATLHLIIEFFGIILFLLILFLVLFFRQHSLKDHADALLASWRGALLYIFFSILIIPVLVFFLYISIIGVMIIPIIFLFIIIIAYYGFLGACIRLGSLFLRKGNDSMPHLFLGGFIGLLVLKGPVLLGILFTLTASEILTVIGSFLAFLGSIALFIVVLYGFGATLINLRQRS
ncbi:MAG: hypothetical protein JXJ04_12510 [Spirochaetales bacterium]|nr:hypothetical protein [Spirochaetales bacterium]